MAKGGNIDPNGGGATYNFDTGKYIRLIIAGCDAAALKSLLIGQRNIRLNLSKAGTGKQWPGLRYRSSQPGRPPAVQTGSLRNSWQTGAPNQIRSASRTGYRIGSALPYARRLEYGGGRIAARPYLRPALLKLAPQVPAIFQEQIVKALKSAGVTAR